MKFLKNILPKSEYYSFNLGTYQGKNFFLLTPYNYNAYDKYEEDNFCQQNDLYLLETFTGEVRKLRENPANTFIRFKTSQNDTIYLEEIDFQNQIRNILKYNIQENSFEQILTMIYTPENPKSYTWIYLNPFLITLNEITRKVNNKDYNKDIAELDTKSFRIISPFYLEFPIQKNESYIHSNEEYLYFSYRENYLEKRYIVQRSKKNGSIISTYEGNYMLSKQGEIIIY